MREAKRCPEDYKKKARSETTLLHFIFYIPLLFLMLTKLLSQNMTPINITSILFPKFAIYQCRFWT